MGLMAPQAEEPRGWPATARAGREAWHRPALGVSGAPAPLEFRLPASGA